MLGKPSSQHRTDGCGYGGEPGPGSDRAAAVILGKISADQRQTTGDEQCSTNPLYASGNNQPSNIGRAAAQGGGSGKERNTNSENLAAAVQVP